jgi:glycosyltransferase involved in cell wall biosynthesis
MMRILHVVHSMPRHGTETWLMNVLRNVDREKFQMDFLVHTMNIHPYDDEIRTLGSQILPCLYPSKPWIYSENFKQIARMFGPYDVIHSHIHHYSGFILKLAHQAGIPMRIAHSHSDSSIPQAQARLHRRAYFRLMRYWITRYATRGLAVSQQAALALFGPRWQADSRWQVLQCGIDLKHFKLPVDCLSIRTELGIPRDAFVVGHVGRFFEPKNHSFLINIFAEVSRKNPEVFLLLVGDGPLKASIEQKVARLGLTERVIFAGSRSDIPQIMLGAMDVFLFPSLYEGLGLVLIEAQAAGLTCILSDVIPREADVIESLIYRLPLSGDASAWADTIISSLKNKQKFQKRNHFEEFKKTEFNILNGIKKLTEIYISTTV